MLFFVDLIMNELLKLWNSMNTKEKVAIVLFVILLILVGSDMDISHLRRK